MGYWIHRLVQTQYQDFLCLKLNNCKIVHKDNFLIKVNSCYSTKKKVHVWIANGEILHKYKDRKIKPWVGDTPKQEAYGRQLITEWWFPV